MTIHLNDDTSMVLCDPTTPGSLCAAEFEAQDSWVFRTDLGERFATRYQYTTKYARDKKLYFKCGNAVAAIKQAIIEATGKKRSLRDIHFKIIQK